MEKRRMMTLGAAILGVMAVAVLLWAVGSARASPSMGPLTQGGAPLLLNYQGRLADPTTSLPKPDGPYTITFKIHDAETDGTLIWAEAQVVTVTRGLFNVLLGSSTALSASDFDGTSRWLELGVEGETLSPRVRMVSVPYAIQAEEAKNAWRLTGNAGTDPATNFLGTTDGVSLTLAVSNTVALRLEPTSDTPNVIGGYSGNSITEGVVGSTVSGGGTAEDGNWDGYPDYNRVTDDYGTVGGGRNNQAGNDDGYTWDAQYATIGGGLSNIASGYAATVGGGEDNTASGDYATVCGGGGYIPSMSKDNTASDVQATVGGGNTASGYAATIGGGLYNIASGDVATVSGGEDNTASGVLSTVGGGRNNTASGGLTYGSTTVGGGEDNTASGWWAIIGGGLENVASGETATVGGGYRNTASAIRATVGGGMNNTASGWFATVPGGGGNTASGYAATVPGGKDNTAQGYYSFAAGRRAKANHDGAFVWADSTDADFASTGNDQFMVRASGGVVFTTTVGALLRLEPNATSPNLIGGYSGNSVTTGVVGATIGGGGASGYTNRVTDDYGTVGGGRNNQAGDNSGTTSDQSYATVGGGDHNTANGYATTVAGGRDNTAGSEYATVGGGWSNDASGARATVSGGHGNTASGHAAIVGGGYSNEASGYAATVGGGAGNTASGFKATVGGGSDNTASGDRATVGGGFYNIASGGYATVGGGINNTAQGYYSFAAGRRAKANHQGAFVWADSTEADFASTANDQFLVRATGGVHLDVDTDGGGLSIEPNATSPNLVGGYSGNSITAGVVGATIGGGGSSGSINEATANYATVGGGDSNTASGTLSTVGGGRNNTASGGLTYGSATVGGGEDNTASGWWATIGGGLENIAGGETATVGGGYRNTASGKRTTVGGGMNNTASGWFATVPGGGGNTASGYAATVPGGKDNTAQGYYSFAAGRRAKANHDGAFVWADSTDADFASTANDQFVVRASGGVVFTTTVGALLRLEPNATSPNLIGGYGGNSVTAGVMGATIGGGGSSGSINEATANYATVGGGDSNTASGTLSTVGGGRNNTASGGPTYGSATVGGGEDNTASGWWATIGGGLENVASGETATVGGGYRNTASGKRTTVGGGMNNTASGWFATVPGGGSNTAQGYYSFAAGRRAKANNQGCFVWGDSTDADVTCSNDNRWVARASGGVYFYSNSSLTSGVYVAAGGNSWNSISDRATKENFTAVDGRTILDKLAALSVQDYNLKSQDPSIRHIGPVAQDFYAAFGYGESDRAINMEDADGVALAATQGLYGLTQEQAARIEELEAENVTLQERLDDLEARVAALEKTLNTDRPPTSSTGLPTLWPLFAGLPLLGLVLTWRQHRGGGR